jgi:hypothetical protein
MGIAVEANHDNTLAHSDGQHSAIRFHRNGCALCIFNFAHDLARKPLTLFGIMR